MFRTTRSKANTGADSGKRDEDDASTRSSRVRYSSAGNVPAVARNGSRPRPSASERAYGADRIERNVSMGSRDPDAKKGKGSASERAFGGFGGFGAGKGMRPAGFRAPAGADNSCPLPPSLDASRIVDAPGDRARLAALAEAMEGRSDAEQLALIQEVMLQDENATDSWLQIDKLDALATGVQGRGSYQGPKVDQELLDAVEENMLFTPEGMEQFLEGGATDRLSNFQDASKDLRWFVNNHGVAMAPADLQSAVDEFKNGRSDGWNKKLDDTQAAVVADGERILSIINDPRMRSLSDAQRTAMMQTLIDPENPAGTTVLAMSLGQDGGVEPELLDGAMTFFADTGLRDSNPDLANVVANARVQSVSRAIEEIDPSDPASAAAARAEISKLRSQDYASLSGIGEDKLDELDATVDALEDTVRPGASPEEIKKSLETFGARADELDGPDACSLDGLSSGSNVAEGMRLLALQSGSVSLGEAGFDFEEGAGSLADLVGFSSDTTALLKEVEIITGTGRLTRVLGSNGLGGVLIGVSALQTLQALGDGDYLKAGLGAASVALGIAGLMSSSMIVPGLGLVVLGAGLGLDHYRSIQESNEYMTGEAEEFLQHSGLSDDIANSLTDQSGGAYSPVPFLFAYASSRGLNREQTVAWLNSLGENAVSKMRDKAHHSLDQINGDIGKMGAQNTAGITPEIIKIFDDFDDFAAQDWESFDMVLELIGITPPS